MRSNIKLTPGIRFLDSTFDPESGLRFTADIQGHLGAKGHVLVHDRAGGLMDALPLADIDPEWSIEEVANNWLDEHR